MKLFSPATCMRAVSSLICVLAMTSAIAEDEPKVLNIYNWSDYIAEDTIPGFEKETGIKVRYDIFDSNEILHAKLVGGKTGYDIVVPSASWANIQIQGGLLHKLDKQQLPNWKYLDTSVLAELAKFDPGNQYLVDWLWGYTTIGINVKKVKEALGDTPMPDNTWDLVFKPLYMAKLKSCGVSFLDAASEVFPVVLNYLGKHPRSKNAADYQDAFKVMQSIRPYITLYSSSGYINDLANGSVCISLGWSGDINIARQRAIAAKNGNDIEVLIPKGGVLAFYDTMAIPADAPHPNNAHKFMNYILRPEVAAALTNKVSYANANTASIKFVKKEVAENPTVFLSAENKKKLIPDEPITADMRRLSTRLYTKFKTGM